ncbi:uncharacterized protein LOC113161900 [Anabas testudineus]|uniref:uncharacterized protein LOC113161900 n=1 Tax=Anabas testudineus TaxID=64144 RepID=UPI00143D33BA|nr:uncharacterized protein LOC113161900 [Anabas testudineus]
MRTRVVETVYVTEHDRSSSGRFRSDRTYQISAELIHALQSPVLDITTFLIRMGYFLPMWGLNGNDNEEINYPEPAEQQMLHTYNGWTATTGQNYDSGFLSDIFQQQLDAYTSPFSYDQQVNYTDNVTQDNSGLMAVCREMQHPHRSQYYPPPEWYQPYEVFNEEAKKRRGGGGCSLVKLLLGVGAFVGAFCFAAKCFSWLRSWFKVSPDESIVKMIPWRPAIYKHTHIMLDYVY